MRAYVAVTDPVWLRRLASHDVREANFWQPSPVGVRQDRGTPWIFKVRGTDLVAGYGFFSYYTVMPTGVAWETFGIANGVDSFAEMRVQIGKLRHSERRADVVGCVVLSELTVLSPERYIAAPRDWAPNIVRGRYYDLADGEGAVCGPR